MTSAWIGVALAASVVVTSACSAGSAGDGGPDGAGRVAAVAQVMAGGGPSPSAATGRLVAGLPPVIPIPPGATITASARQPQGGLVAVSVTGTSRSTTTDLLAFFHTRLAAASFTATDDSLLPAGASGAAFGRGGNELLVVAVVDRGTTRSWSVGGTLTP